MSFCKVCSRSLSMLALSLAALALLSACGNNKTASGVGCPGATGNFNNASLPAGSQWTYQLSGYFLNQSFQYVPYTAAGVFTVDGKGNISSGFDDAFGAAFTGSYSISGNGTGNVIVNLTSLGQSLTWAVTISATNPGSIYLMEAESNFNASGIAYQQTTSAFNAAPTGTFVFRTHALTGGSNGATASVGVMSVNAGTIATLNEDVFIMNQGSSQRTLSNAISPVFSVPDNTGTGTVTFADSQGLTSAYNYYVIDANTYLLFETDAANGGLGLGRLEAQSAPGGGFTNASLSGNYALGSRGDTSVGGAFSVNSAAQFTTDGAGNIDSGSYDTVRDGATNLNAPIISTGTASTYSVASNGRTTVTLNASGTVIQQTLYLVSASRAFFLVGSDITRVEDGTVEQQSSGSFSSTDFKGQFAFVMGGFSSTTPLDRNGTLTSDGSSSVGWAEVVNSGGSVNIPGCLSGTYTVATNGRVSASVNQLSPALVLYLVSPNKLYTLQGDSSVQMFGGAALQSGAVINPPGAF